MKRPQDSSIDQKHLVAIQALRDIFAGPKNDRVRMLINVLTKVRKLLGDERTRESTVAASHVQRAVDVLEESEQDGEEGMPSYVKEHPRPGSRDYDR